MTHEAKELLQKASVLPDNERAELAANLIASLDEVSDPDADLAWQTEVTRRMNDVQTGKVNTVSRDEVQRKARSMLNEH
jgi:putative addiction module component (TIGR02574 family)